MTYNELLEWHFNISVKKMQLQHSTKPKDKKEYGVLVAMTDHFRSVLHHLDNKENGLNYTKYKSPFRPASVEVGDGC